MCTLHLGHGQPDHDARRGQATRHLQGPVTGPGLSACTGEPVCACMHTREHTREPMCAAYLHAQVSLCVLACQCFFFGDV
jgi:hypothetical protein